MKLIKLPTKTAIRYGSLWSGLSDSVCPPGTLFINRGVIETENNGRAPQTLDLSSYTLLPALIDCHVHLMLPYNDNEASPALRARNLLHTGVAAVRDAGSQKPWQQIPELTVTHTGYAITKKGYYGENLGIAVDGLTEACRLIDTLAARGVSQIKLIASGIFSFSHYGKIGSLPFSEDELSTLVSHAAANGLPVMAHASGDIAVQHCLHAGIRCIEHGYFTSRETLKKMASMGAYWVPTLAPVAAWLENPGLLASLSVKQKQVIRLTLNRQQEMVAQAGLLGVRIGAGTDAGAPGVPHGPSLLREMELLFASGLARQDVLKAATSTAAEICGLPDYGALAAGKKAAILAVSGNPAADLNVLHAPNCLLLPS
ncbi:MAG: amidohydrolase family protein [Bacillota bacterium]|nr:amidohydrolase family protein [Bacillota bacterium]MDW7683896.1 amidohydrolase family protein [Bacillota bacterium]